MKKLLSSILLLLTLSTISFAQKVNPAKWTWSLSKPNPEVGETVDVIFTVSIQKDWYLYSSDFDPDLGPTVTTIKFTPNDSYETVGSLKAINPSRKFDKEIWNGEYSYFKGKAEFRQTVKILKDKNKNDGSLYSKSCSCLF